ncbi:DNA polymerase III subunit delta [Polynucleobacter paneuropaeus]|uniref:DNA polymerase III subunit delta n=1 Tax=Polynucleobacter paneuropaeus TaxID=2527775 RepID=A0ABX9FC94_9BURK|nr:DNA polymerase III subunit delta [Polynucleobacter paneuropaeus]MBT8578495.1 DNA polymerase III subunit delta [Polynucleobacter paneuropaeus]MBT8581994.1 DNA polymerase III subunit delta [Polynucleobacter paneuropaeus]MBT8583110.1 DNA polymerase III subunit delta [Polynucleobacter paneuropaeus]MBT8585772.1 DNA polymerase III subunit delta [Polynucleobacter paneuropaeus]MBT8586951.1 DNA polymerase III subunit delta [Polynucleobacter paneuropaeus]
MVKTDAFQSHLKSLAAASAFHPLYVFSGDEPLLMMESIDLLRSKARQLGYTEREVMLQERGFDWSALLNAGQTMSLFGDRRWIELRIPTGKPGRDGADALKQFSVQIASQSNADGPETIFCIVLPRLDMKTKSSAWFSSLDEAGMAVQIDSLDRSHLPSWIAGRLQKQGQSIQSGPAGQRALEFIAEQVEGNLIAAHQEIQKLGLLYPAGELSEEQVRSAILKVARYNVFELSEAMLAGDLPRVNRMLDGLKGEGEPLVLILWSVTEELRLLSKLKMASDAGESVQQLLRANRVWGNKERLYPAALKRVQSSRLRQAVQIAAGLDRQSKGLQAAELPGDPWDGLRLVGNLLR